MTCPTRFQPEEWSDPKRASFLMREFRAREANPDGYDDKLSFWVRNINLWSRNARPCFSIRDVREAFARDGIPPDYACIDHVFRHLISKGSLQRKSELEKLLKQRSSGGDSWTSWGLSLITRPVSWSLSLIASSSEYDTVIKEQEEFVNVESLKRSAELLINELTKTGKQIFRFNEVANCEVVQRLNTNVLDLVLLSLAADKRLILLEDCGRKLIKIGENPTFSNSEVGLQRLEVARELIEGEIKQIERQMESLKDEARAAVRQDNKIFARQLLKRKKRFEMLLAKKGGQLDNIDVLIRQLEDSDSQDVVLQSYQEAAEVLRSLQKKTPPDADQTIADLEEAIHATNDLTLDLSRVIDPLDSKEDELEEELSEILGNEFSTAAASSSVQAPAIQEVDELLIRLHKLKSDLPEPGESALKSGDKEKKTGVKA